MYRATRDILLEVDNAYLSSGTVNLLKTALNDNSVDENSVKVRQRSIILLGLSRNSEAITVISNRLKHDPSRRVRFNAAKSLGRLAGEASIPALKVALVEDRISGAVIQGLGGAGGRAVPLLIQMLKDDLKKGGNGANWFIQSLRRTGDRRAIKPLLDIISRPTSPSDRHMSRVQLEAARVLAHFATEWYVDILESRAKFSAVHPVTPTENRKVKAADQIRIVEALQNAGYDLNSLIWPLTFDKEE
jgi:HEAT repeat protein